jgi:hypothetical protein
MATNKNNNNKENEVELPTFLNFDFDLNKIDYNKVKEYITKNQKFCGMYIKSI